MTSFNSATVSRFNVLDRTEFIHRNLMLEASAGTGKTFAIENIVVRLLIEPKETSEPLLIEQILVVTFTRMAARELRERIHSNLERSLDLLKRFLSGEEIENQCPDYLLAKIESGEKAVRSAIKHIEMALFSFDRAQIYTIHGFCWRMLKSYCIEAGISLDASCMEDRSLSTTQLMQVVRDFLGKELFPSIYSPRQLKIIMEKSKGNSEKLQKDLLNVINRGIEIKSPPAFVEFLADFQCRMGILKQEFAFEGAKIIEDFLALAPSYNELLNRSKQVRPEKMVKVERFAALFDKEEWCGQDLDVLIEDGLILLEAFDPCLLKAKAKPLTSVLNYPDLLGTIKMQLAPLIAEARNEASIFSRMASDCQKFVLRFKEQKEMFGHNDLLVQMSRAIRKPDFVSCVRSQYSAAIVDEFQDTDPVQWEIFSVLFASNTQEWNGHLNLVGDPKQSIYAFRQADIYTYLSAAKKLGAGSIATLDTNFRSRSSLIDALNILFDSARDTFSLPKLSQSLAYRNVDAGRKDISGLHHKEPSLYFLEAKHKSKSRNPLKEVEAGFLFPAIAKEILLLNEQEGIRFGQFAILIGDRHQASRVSDYLRALDIPVKSQKGIDLSRSHAVAEMRDVLNGILRYTSKSSLNVALAGRLIGMTHRELIALEKEGCLFPVVEKFHQFNTMLYAFGFARFFQCFMESSWHTDKKSVLERLLNETGGPEFYREWQDLADLLISEEQSRHLLPAGVLGLLDELKDYSSNDDDRIKAYVDNDQDGVSVLTTHVSKGLEFDIVFALGMINRTKKTEELIPVEIQEQYTLCAVEKEDPLYRKFCEEIDAEKMRQLYVALTRARERLYLPVVIDENQREIPIGHASPMELFLARLDKPETDYEGLYQRIVGEDGLTLVNLIDKHPGKMKLLELSRDVQPYSKKKQLEKPLLFPPKGIIVPGNPQTVQSFTSLSHTKSSTPQSYDEELLVPHDFTGDVKTEHTLPSGNETGIILHKIFENLPFDSVKNLVSHKGLVPLISPFLKNTPFSQWGEVVAMIVFQSLNTPLDDASNFCLADVDPIKIYRETEFLYPCEAGHAMFNGVAAKSGYLKGVVDVFFEHQGKYYLLDWKSNWLGPSQDYYSRKHLEEAMMANHYDLQAAIYREAFQRYLRVFDKRPFEEIFGGVYYLFVRGISLTTGILHIKQ